MSTKEVWAGLDVSKLKFDAALAAEGPKRVEELGKSCFEMTPEGAGAFLRWADGLAGGQDTIELHAVMESTGRYSADLAGLLRAAGLESKPRIVNPRLMSHFAKSLGLKNKTDSLDAGAIARYGVERRPEEPLEKPAVQAELQRVTRARAALVKARISVVSQTREAKGVAPVSDAFDAVRKCLDEQIKALELEMARIVDSDRMLRDDAKTLLSIPGFGKINACTILGEFGDLRRFARRAQLVAFAGLNPVLKRSGSSVRSQCGISKAGSREARRVMHLAARAAVKAKTPNPFQAFYNTKVKGGKSKLSAYTAVMRKMLLVARAVIIKNERFSLSTC